MANTTTVPDLLIAETDERLVPPKLKSTLEPHRRLLQPFTLAGFETDLAYATRFDLQVAVFHRGPEFARLLTHLRALRSDIDDPDAQTAAVLLPALERAQAPNDRFGLPHSLWLEFDLCGPKERLPMPSLFSALESPATRRDSAPFQTYLSTLMGPQAPTLPKETLDRLFDALADDEAISHVGWMLGRTMPFLRLVVQAPKDSDPGEAARRLTGQAAPPGWMPLWNTLRDDLQFSRLCLDLHASSLALNGIECFPVPGEARAGALSRLLKKLKQTTRGSDDLFAALEAWEGGAFPAPDRGPWPLAMIWPGLSRPTSDFPVFEKSVSHFKLSESGSGQTRVKAYWGGELTTWALEAAPLAPDTTIPAASTESAGQVQQMLDFIQACRQQEHLRSALEQAPQPSLEALRDLAAKEGLSFQADAFHQAFAIDWHMRWRRLHRPSRRRTPQAD